MRVIGFNGHALTRTHNHQRHKAVDVIVSLSRVRRSLVDATRWHREPRRPRFSFFLFSFQRARRHSCLETEARKSPPSGEPNDRKNPSPRLEGGRYYHRIFPKVKHPRVGPAGRPRWARGGVYRWDRRGLSTTKFRFFREASQPLRESLDSPRSCPIRAIKKLCLGPVSARTGARPGGDRFRDGQMEPAMETLPARNFPSAGCGVPRCTGRLVGYGDCPRVFKGPARTGAGESPARARHGPDKYPGVQAGGP